MKKTAAVTSHLLGVVAGAGAAAGRAKGRSGSWVAAAEAIDQRMRAPFVDFQDLVEHKM